MRYQRVEQVLESEPRFKAQMTSKSEVVLKPNGEKQLFAPVVIQVTEAIHAQGQDAHKAQKMDIIRVAMEFFRPGRTQAERTETPKAPAAPAERPAPRPTPPVTEAAAPVQAKRPSPAKRPAAGGPVKPAEPKETTPVTDEQPQAAPRNDAPARPAASRSGDDEEARASEGRRTSTSDPAYNPYISIFSLLLQAAECIDKLDTQPGKEKRLKSLEEMAVEYRKFTGIPRHA